MAAEADVCEEAVVVRDGTPARVDRVYQIVRPRGRMLPGASGRGESGGSGWRPGVAGLGFRQRRGGYRCSIGAGCSWWNTYFLRSCVPVGPAALPLPGIPEHTMAVADRRYIRVVKVVASSVQPADPLGLESALEPGAALG